MTRAFWLSTGIGIGVLVAHLVDSTPRGRAFFTDLNARAREFAAGVASGYRSREAELRDDPTRTAPQHP